MDGHTKLRTNKLPDDVGWRPSELREGHRDSSHTAPHNLCSDEPNRPRDRLAGRDPQRHLPCV